MATNFEKHTINDPIHGSIKLSNKEIEIVNTPSFQRLRRLKQLGLAELVFPGSSHSRFAHSIGTLHVVTQMLNSVIKNGAKIPESQVKLIRIAALLHDIGHLPLSHAMELPIQRMIYEDSDFLEPHNIKNNSFGPLDEMANANIDDTFKHETFGSDLLCKRQDLSEVLGTLNKNNEIGKIITRDHPDFDKFSQFISSSLDADRLDFLLRDSIYSGVTYGKIDLDYILENLRYDNKNHNLYIANKGINALEHFLTARYHNYNIIYHKTVLGFELMAKIAFYEMCKSNNKIPSTSRKLLKFSKLDKDFVCFNDEYFWKILNQWSPRKHYLKKIKFNLLNRKPLITLYEERQIVPYDTNPSQHFKCLSDNIYSDNRFSKLLVKHNIDKRYLALLTNKIKFEVLPHQTNHQKNSDPEKEKQLCRVMINGKIEPLIDIEGSTINKLSDGILFIKRLYYLPVNNNTPNKSKFKKSLEKLFDKIK